MQQVLLDQAFGLYEGLKFDKMNKQIDFRGEGLKQIIHLEKQLEEDIIYLEKNCDIICRRLEQKFQAKFEQCGHRIVIELIRIKNGKNACALDVFESDYESFIEVGLEHDNEYFPNCYIPLWKCKTEWFQKIGYLTKRNTSEIEKIIDLIAFEMLEDAEGD
jgi:hypothetical protein